MTQAQWDKVNQRVRGLVPTATPGDAVYMDALRQLVDPINEVQLDVDNSIARDLAEQNEIDALEVRLAELKARQP